MAATAPQVMYRQEHILAFERKQSLLRASCTQDVEVKGNSVVFLVADSGSAEAVTRGANGLIPNRPDNLTQVTCTLEEWHDKVQKTGFIDFTSQGDQRRIMQETSAGVMNRKLDELIIAQLNTATNDTGAAATMSFNLIQKALAIAGNADVPFDGNVWGVLTPSAMAYLMGVDQFSNAEYVKKQPLVDGAPLWKDAVGYYDWLGVKWISHTGLPGKATNAEKCFLYHRNAIGIASPAQLINAEYDYNKEDDYSYVRTSMYVGAKLLQNSGVVVINHDGSGMVAA